MAPPRQNRKKRDIPDVYRAPLRAAPVRSYHRAREAIMDRHRWTYPCGKLRPAAGPTRRQFVGGLLVGAAAAGCTSKASMLGPVDATIGDGSMAHKTATDRVTIG